MSGFKYLGMIIALVVCTLSVFLVQSLAFLFDATVMSLLNAVIAVVFVSAVLILYRIE